MIHALSPFATGFALSAALIIAIGAQNLFVLRQGLKREHVGAIVLFCGGTDALLIASGVSGVGAVLAAVPQLTRALALGGAAFLGWYGTEALRRAKTAESMTVATSGGMTLARAMAATAGFTFLNPHVYLDTVLLMGTAGAAQPPALRPFFVGGAACASFTWFVMLGYGARLLAPVFARPLAWRMLDVLVGLTMLVLSGSLIVRAMTAM
ncbi:MAG: LysE/ArgO family amino acid transporter [Novosphingobium sp.]